MRKYSTLEKRILKEITNLTPQNSNLGEFIAKMILTDRAIKLDFQKKEIQFIYLKTDKNAVIEFFELISILDYLEKKGLIFIHTNSNMPLSDGILTSNIDQNYLDTKVELLETIPIPTNLYTKIIQYIQSFVICGTEILFLVQNEFKTEEQIAHEKELEEVIVQTKTSKISLYIAFVALFFSFLSPFIFDTTIDKSQFDRFEENNEKINNSLKDIKKELLKINIDSICSLKEKDKQLK